MRYKLIAFDLDGTALRDDKTMTERLRKACQRAEEKGAVCVISSGRMYSSTLRFTRFLGIHGPVINCQGASVSDSATDRLLYSRPLTREQLTMAVEFYREKGIYAQANDYMNFYSDMPSDRYFKFYGDQQGFPGIPVEDLCTMEAQALKTVGMTEPEVIDRLFPEARERFDGIIEATLSAPTMLEFTHPEATKGNAMDFLAKHCGVDRSEMIAVGDSFNDIPMLEYAGLSVAMGNAREEVRQIADVIAPTNEEDGVAYIIEKFILE